jgi:hypothetical protein
VQRTRIIGYVDPDTVRVVEQSDYTKSGFVREAIREKVDREGLADE